MPSSASVPVPVHPRERERVAALERLGLLDAPADPRLDVLVEAAARLLGTSAARLVLLGDGVEVVRAAYGPQPDDEGPCRVLASWAVADGRPLVVEDLGRDVRFAAAATAGWRAYAAVPLLHDGLPLGVLAVASGTGPAPGDDDVARLERLAEVAVSHLLATRPASGPRGASSSRRVRAAVAAGSAQAVYAPVVRLADAGLHGVRALPDLTGASSAALVSLGEQGDLVVAVDRAVLEQACTQVQAWRTAFPSAVDLRLSVSTTARSLERGDLADVVRACLERSALAPSVLVLEVAETLLLHDDGQAVRTLAALRELGVGVALDDFGGGYSSLDHLRRFPVTSLTVAQEFVAGLGGGGPEEALVEAVLGLADRLGLDVVAKGVDTQARADVLRALGCRYGQGPLWSHARRAPDLEGYLLQSSAAASLDTWAEILRRRRGSD